MAGNGDADSLYKSKIQTPIFSTYFSKSEYFARINIGYAFDDYEKARLWVLAWVRDYNNNMKKTVKDETGKFVPSDEPVLIEVKKDVWECFNVDIEILSIGEIDMDGFETSKATEGVYLS